MIENDILSTKAGIKNDINSFKKMMVEKYGIEFRVYSKIDSPTFVTLETLENIVIEAFHDEYPDLIYIKSLKAITRKREFITYKTIFCYIGASYGYGKSTMGNYVGNNHASVINLLRNAADYEYVKDRAYFNAKNKVIEYLTNYVAIISNTTESGDNPESMPDIIFNKRETLCAVH